MTNFVVAQIFLCVKLINNEKHNDAGGCRFSALDTEGVTENPACLAHWSGREKSRFLEFLTLFTMKNSFEKFAHMAISKEGLKKFAGGLAITGASSMGSDTPAGLACYYYNDSGDSFSESGTCSSPSEDACDYYGTRKYSSMGFKGKCR